MSQGITQRIRWTTQDLELLPENEGIRYEIIDGELFVTRAPHARHQRLRFARAVLENLYVFRLEKRSIKQKRSQIKLNSAVTFQLE